MNFNDEPKLFHYTCKLKDNKKISDAGYCDPYTGGNSFDKKRSEMKALGEAIERYSLSIYKNSNLITTSYEKIKNKALNPNDVVVVSKKQLAKKQYEKFRIDEKSKIRWARGYSIKQKKNIYVPAQMVYVPYAYFKGEKLIQLPITTGAATSTTMSGAIYRGICEIVERDAYMIAYLNKLKLKKISNSHPLIKDIAKYFERYNLELHLFETTTDINIPCFMGILIDRTGEGPAVSVGLSANLDAETAAIGAIEEAQHSRPWMREMYLKGDRFKGSWKNLTSLEQRGLLWYDQKMIKYLDFWLKIKGKKWKIQKRKSKGTIQDLKTALNRLKNKETIVVDCTIPEIRRKGFKVVKVIIPELHPLFLFENVKYLGGKRIYEVPPKLGYKRKTEVQLNKIPHPFL